MNDFDRFKGTSSYLSDPALEAAVNCALALERPLLVKGEPGTGKTLLATAISQALDLELIAGDALGYTRLDLPRIHVNPGPLLTGHPDGFFTEELQYLLTSARAYGYSLEAYSASIRSRFLWPLLTLLLALAAAFLGARAKPSTGIYFPFAVMLLTYLTGFGLVHLATQL